MVAGRKLGKGVGSKSRLEDILAEELKREMFLDSGGKFRYIDDWENLMHSVYELPVEYGGYEKKVSDLRYLKEIVDILTRGDFEQVKRSESRRKYAGKPVEGMHMYYNIIFTRKDSRVGYGAMIHFSEVKKGEVAERSNGIVLTAKLEVNGQHVKLNFEKAKFNDFLIEVKPYIDLLGDLYRKTRKP